MKNELSRITVDIPSSMHKKLKALAAHKRVSMRRIIEELIDLRLSTQDEGECLHGHIPNKKTAKALKDAEAKKGLKKYKNAKDLFKKLGI